MMKYAAPTPSADWCLFLDVDGTLIDFTDSPQDTRSDECLNRLLQDVERSLAGRIALVSGRGIGKLDELFAPLRFAAAGLHGAERRSASGVLHRAAIAGVDLDGAREALRAFAARCPGTRFEDKGLALALHYRAAPHFEAPARGLVRRVAAGLGAAFHIQEGNMVLEIKPSGYTKVAAIEAFLAEPPFAGHTPVFVGDDYTDCDGLRFVEASGGISVAVGDRVRAQWHLPDPTAVRDWLGRIAALKEHGQ
ncbi:MAG TPA: trehalose-phosphatase [Steroidobacteraceae bacterium]|nr:trehalose-phosphatase [Steroidobacteraceae bacterium]